MDYQYVLTDVAGGIGFIWINRPEVRNALNGACWQELRSAFMDMERSDGVRVIILTGVGEKAFSAGADVGVLLERTVGRTLDGENAAVTLAIEQCPKPTIAAINGLALGGGCELALACDMRLASRSARIGLTELNVGILPGAGGTQRLARLIGSGRALEMVLTGRPVTAEEAWRTGLVNAVTEPGQLLPEAIALAKSIAEKSPLTARLAKLAIRGGVNADYSSALLIELLSQSVVFGGEDHSEGLRAFLEKRSPEYTGR